MASFLCGLPASKKPDENLMPGEDKFSSSLHGGEKQVVVIPPRRRLRESRGLTPTVWRKAFDTQGRITNLTKLLGKIQRGGVDPSIRGEVWELLLGAWPPESTAEERRVLRSECRLLYAEALEECRKVHPGIGSGRLAYAVNDAPILDARTPRPKVSQEAESATTPLPDLEMVARNPLISSHDGTLLPPGKAPQPSPAKLRCNSFSGRTSLEWIKFASLEAKDLGWGAKFLLLILEREGRLGEPGVNSWLENVVASQLPEAQARQEVDGREAGVGTQVDSVAHDEHTRKEGVALRDGNKSVRGGTDDLEREALLASGVQSFMEGGGALEAWQQGEFGTVDYLQGESVPALGNEEMLKERTTLLEYLKVSSGRDAMSAPQDNVLQAKNKTITAGEEKGGEPNVAQGEGKETLPAEDNKRGEPHLVQSEGKETLAADNEKRQEPHAAQSEGRETLTAQDKKRGEPHSAPREGPVATWSLGKVRTMVLEIERRARELELEAEAALVRAPSARRQTAEVAAVSNETGEELGPPTAKAFYIPKLSSPPTAAGPPLSEEVNGQDLVERTDGRESAKQTDSQELSEQSGGPETSAQVDGHVSAEGCATREVVKETVCEGPVEGREGHIAFERSNGQGDETEGRQSISGKSDSSERIDSLESSVRTDAHAATNGTDGQDASEQTDTQESAEPRELIKQALSVLFKAVPLTKSKSAAVIVNHALSDHLNTDQGDDESFATPMSHFTTFSSPGSAFFTPTRSLSAFSTPKSAAYTTPGEGFFTPDKLLRSSSASPALSKSSGKRRIPKPSNWSTRKGESPLDAEAHVPSAGQKSASATEGGLGRDSDQQVSTVGECSSQMEGQVVERVEIIEDQLEIKRVAPRTSRRLFTEGPDSDSKLAIQPAPQDGTSTSLEKTKAATFSSQTHTPKGKEQKPDDLVLIVERGGALTALGQGPAVSSSFLRPLHIGHVSRTADGLRITWTSWDSSPSLVVPRKNRLLTSSNGSENYSGPVEAASPDPAVQAQTDEVLTGPQAEKAADWLWALHRIVIDVVRTDRHLAFFDETENLVRMADILAVYAWLDPDVGYCQGMSDLLSPFVVLFKDNADAFWCFERLMRRMRQNFGMGGPLVVLRQLDQLREIVEVTDPTVGRHLELAGVDNFLFAFRMLLVRFRRELGFSQALTLWEMTWAADFKATGGSKDGELEPLLKEDVASSLQGPLPLDKGRRSRQEGDDDLCMYCVAAILHHNRTQLKREVHEMDDAVKLFNGMDLKLDVRACVESAIKRRKKYMRKRKAERR